MVLSEPKSTEAILLKSGNHQQGRIVKAIRIIGLAALIFVLATSVIGVACAGVAGPEESQGLTKEDKIFALVNEARVSAGLDPLVRIDAMDALALGHSQDMAKTGVLSHDGFDARADSIMELLGASSVGENVAMGYDSAKAFVDGWLNSQGHKANIMTSSYRRTGIGCYKSYATQIFCD